MSTSFHNITMIQTQIQLEERVHEQIRSLAFRKKISVSETMRRLVCAGLARGLDGRGQERVPGEVLLEIAGISSSGLGDLGRNHDQYLSEDFGE